MPPSLCYTCQLFLKYRREIFILGVLRFLSWECWDFWKRHNHYWMFLKKSKVFRRLPSVTKAETALAFPSPSFRKHINASFLRVVFASKIRDREEGIFIYLFYTWFSFHTWVWVNIFLEIVSSKTATTHIFQSGMRNWSGSVSRCEIKVFNLQEVRLVPKAWELAGIPYALPTGKVVLHDGFIIPLPDFIPWGPGYESVYYGINNTTPIYSERTHQALQNLQVSCQLGQYWTRYSHSKT